MVRGREIPSKKYLGLRVIATIYKTLCWYTKFQRLGRQGENYSFEFFEITRIIARYSDITVPDTHRLSKREGILFLGIPTFSIVIRSYLKILINLAYPYSTAFLRFIQCQTS